MVDDIVAATANTDYFNGWFVVDIAFCLVILRYDLTLQRKRRPVPN